MVLEILENYTTKISAKKTNLKVLKSQDMEKQNQEYIFYKVFKRHYQ
jgi:hypothetical protein